MNYEVGLSRRWIFTILFWYGESLESPRHSVGYSTVGERLMAFHKRCVSSACFYSYSWKFLARRSINPSIRDLFFFLFFLFLFFCFFQEHNAATSLFSLLQIGALKSCVSSYIR